MSWTRVKGVENEGAMKTISHQPWHLSPLLFGFRPDPERESSQYNDVYIFESIDDCKLGHLISMINMMMARTCGECDSNYTDGHNMDEVCPIGRYLPSLH